MPVMPPVEPVVPPFEVVPGSAGTPAPQRPSRPDGAAVPATTEVGLAVGATQGHAQRFPGARIPSNLASLRSRSNRRTNRCPSNRPRDMCCPWYSRWRWRKCLPVACFPSARTPRPWCRSSRPNPTDTRFVRAAGRWWKPDRRPRLVSPGTTKLQVSLPGHALALPLVGQMRWQV